MKKFKILRISLMTLVFLSIIILPTLGESIFNVNSTKKFFGRTLHFQESTTRGGEQLQIPLMDKTVFDYIDSQQNEYTFDNESRLVYYGAANSKNSSISLSASVVTGLTPEAKQFIKQGVPYFEDYALTEVIEDPTENVYTYRRVIAEGIYDSVTVYQTPQGDIQTITVSYSDLDTITPEQIAYFNDQLQRDIDTLEGQYTSYEKRVKYSKKGNTLVAFFTVSFENDIEELESPIHFVNIYEYTTTL